MLRCLFCDAELSDTLLRAGCCPVCGGRLQWPDEDADDPSTRPASETPAAREPSSSPTLPLPPSPLGTPPSIAPPPRAIKPLESPSPSPQEPPVASQSDRPASGSAEPGGPFSADHLPPEVLARVTSAWSGAFDSREFPRNTIKVSSLDTADVPALVIRPRQLGGRDRPGVEQPDYELLEIIGEGGVGVVYSARQNSIDRMVAVKMLRPDSDESGGPQDKFLAEAVVTGELEHPNIVPIYDLGSSNDGTLFYSMKRVQGTPWDRAMAAKSLPENLEILMKVCDAIAFAHSRGVIHRDIKPENVMLGGFGEVLVMDWGIALSWSTDGRSSSIRQSATMGGTPAYMSPEMATGPLDQIGVPSDVYLLGGLLYEIVTGLSPHTGKTVMDCLYAAAANEIQRTDAGGELVEIALQAMSTEPGDRYQSVQEFQDAIRGYQSHAESIVLSTRAQDDLQLAVREQKYEIFARSLFAFEEAVALWPGNEAAAKGVIEARRAYAEAALNKEDYELGVSLIDPKQPRHARLAEQLAAGQKEQQTRTQRIRVLKQVAVALVIAMMTGGALALVEINDKRARAETEQRKAVDARTKLQDSIDDNTDLLTQQVSLLGDVAKERDRATFALQEEAASRAAAQLAQRREQQEKYVAQIGLAAERVEANAFDQAAELLENYRDSPLAHWEWARLWYICRPHRSMHDATGVVQFARSLPGGDSFVTITREGEFSVWSNADDAPLARFSIGDAAAECALSPDARRLAVAAPDSAEIRLLSLTISDAGIPLGVDEAAPVVTLNGHTGSVTSLEFSRDGAQLLSGSLDHTARLWDVAAARSLLEFQGHSWPVWQAAFSPDPEHRIMATAGQDGRVIVWSTVDGSQVTDFNEHQGPVYCVGFSPDGETVATAGEDRRILVWNWRDVPRLDLKQFVADGTRPEVPYKSLQGHRSSIHCLEFAPSGNDRLVSGGADNTLMVWDVAGESGSAIVPLRGHSRQITTCAFSTDGLQVLSGSEDRKWGLWDVAGFQEVNQLRSTSLRGHENGILAAHFAPNGDGIVTASLDRTARVWDAAAGRERATLREGHEYLATSALLLPGGERLLTAGGDNSARLWDMTVGAQTGVLTGTGRHAAIAVSADGRYALTGAPAVEKIDEAAQTSVRIYARLWDLANQTVVREFSETVAADLVESQPMSAVSAAAISPDGTLFYTGHADGQGRLWREDGAPPVLLQGHTRSVTAAAFIAPDGARLLTASGDQTVAQWDVASGRELLDLSMRHDGWVSSLSLTDDGRTAVTAAEDGLVRIWDVATARELARLGGSGELVDGLAFVNGGASLLWVGDDGVLRVSDPLGEAEERTINAVAGDWIYSAATSPDGERLALITGSGWLTLMDFTAGSVTETIRVEGARDAAFSPGGDWLVCGGADGKLRVIGVASDREPREWQAHPEMIHEIAVSPDGAFVASAGDDGFARIWNAATGELVRELRGQGGAVTALAWSESGESLATGDDDGSVQWWTSDGNLLQTYSAHEGGVGAVAFSPDGTRLVSGGMNRVLRVWERGSTTPIAELDAHEGAIRSLAFSPDGGTLASLAADRAVRLWTTNDWKWTAEIPKGRGMSTHPIGAISADGATVLAGNSGERLFRVFGLDRDQDPVLSQRHQFRTEVGAIWSATLTQDGASLVTVGGDAARVWNPESGREVLTMRPHNVVSAVAYSPDGTQVVTGSWDRSARIWDAVTGRMVRQLTGGHAGSVTQAAWLPDGRIITAGDDGAIRIWDAATGMLEDHSLQENGAAVVSLSVSRDGATAATVSADNVVRVWDVATRALIEEITAAQLGIEGEALLCCALGPEGRLLAVGTPSRTVVQTRGDAESRLILSGHTAAIRAVGFSPDGKRLVTGSEDFTARVWDVASGKEMLSLARHTAAVTAVEFSADGQSVLTAGMDGLAIVWGGDAIAPSVQTGRDRFDYRIGDGAMALDPLAELNAPSAPSPVGLRVRIELSSAGDPAGRMGKLCLIPQESSTATVESHDAPAGEHTTAEDHGAQFEFSEDGRRLEIVFDARAGWSEVNDVLRRIAFEARPEEGAVAMDETHIETVTIQLLDEVPAEDPDGAPAGHVSSIAIYILPAADTDAGSVLQDVEQVLKTLKSREVEQ